MGRENLNLLKELTEELPAIPKLEQFIHNTGDKGKYIEYKADSGTAIGFNLLWQTRVAVQKTFLSANTIFPRHMHEGIELIIVFEGLLEVECEGGELKVLDVGDVIQIKEKIPHHARSIKDSWLIVITIPADKDFPKDKVNEIGEKDE